MRGPLWPLLAAVGLVAVCWVLVVPPFQAPDESGHFGYVQSLAENGERPGGVQGDEPPHSTEHRVAEAIARNRIAGDPNRKPPWGESDQRLWDAVEPRLEGELRRDSSGGEQGGHPPGYYAYEALPYWIGSGGDLFTRLHLMRLWSAALMLVTTAGAWLLIGELVGRDRVLQLTGAACVGLQPMATFVSSGIAPDAALFAVTSVGLWLGVRVIRRGPTRATVAGLLAVTVAAGFVKAAGLALVVPALFALAVGARRRGGRAAIGLAAAGAAAGAAAVVATSALGRGLGERAPVETGLTELRAFGSYVWQFYLPRAPFLDPVEGLGDASAWNVWLKGSWAAFGSGEVRFPNAVYVALAAITVALFAAACVALARRAVANSAASLAFLGLFAAGLLAGAHWVEFWSLDRGEGLTAQGRYLLPLMPLAGCAAALALSLLRARLRVVAAAAVLAGMVALQLVSLATVAGRFYA